MLIETLKRQEAEALQAFHALAERIAAGEEVATEAAQRVLHDARKTTDQLQQAIDRCKRINELEIIISRRSELEQKKRKAAQEGVKLFEKLKAERSRLQERITQAEADAAKGDQERGAAKAYNQSPIVLAHGEPGGEPSTLDVLSRAASEEGFSRNSSIQVIAGWLQKRTGESNLGKLQRLALVLQKQLPKMPGEEADRTAGEQLGNAGLGSNPNPIVS